MGENLPLGHLGDNNSLKGLVLLSYYTFVKSNIDGQKWTRMSQKCRIFNLKI